MVSENACQRSAAPVAEKSQAGALRGLQALVVDDHPDITSLVGEVLIDEGASVVPANSGTAAIALVTLMKFDLVILDLGMPQPDGRKIIEFLRAAEPGLLRRTLVLTGMRYDAGAMGLLEDLGIPYLLKPFQVEDLVRAAARVSLPASATKAAG
jgi:CheY-like chemotaxis protein